MIQLLAIALAASGPALPDERGRPLLAQAVDAYRAGQLGRCDALLDALLTEPSRPPKPELAESLVLRAAVAFANGRREGAREELVRAHGLGVRVAMPPDLFPPDFRDFDLTVRREEAVRIARLQSLSAAPLLPAAMPPRPPRVIILRPTPSTETPLWALAPLGIPQRRRGAVAWGDSLGAAQVAALGIGLGSLAAALAMQGPRGLYSAAQAPTARALNVAYLAGCYGALGLYLLGVADGFAFGSSAQ